MTDETATTNDFRNRTVSGLVLGAVAVVSVLAGHTVFALFVALAALFALYEWYQLSEKNTRPYVTIIAGFIYTAVSATSFVFLRFGFDTGAILALVLICTTAAGDMGAYFTGRGVGGPLLLPAVSPRKTWAGLGGGMVCAGSMMMVCASAVYGFRLWGESDELVSNLPIFFFAGALLGLAGQGGDLILSYFKRQAGVKDTGTLIPGHGGLLDRIDSHLLAAPVFLLVVLWSLS